MVTRRGDEFGKHIRITYRGYRIRPFYEGWVFEKQVPGHTAKKSGRGYQAGQVVKERWVTLKYPHDIDHALRWMFERIVCDHPEEIDNLDNLRSLLREIGDGLKQAVDDGVAALVQSQRAA